eukprot:1887085-Pyramimonas_sp.AAC.1
MVSLRTNPTSRPGLVRNQPASTPARKSSRSHAKRIRTFACPPPRMITIGILTPSAFLIPSIPHCTYFTVPPVACGKGQREISGMQKPSLPQRCYPLPGSASPPPPPSHPPSRSPSCGGSPPPPASRT